MTFFAGYCGVQPKQREVGQVVVKNNIVTPAGCLVTALTLLAFLSFVNIVRLVTAETVNRQVFIVYVTAMAGATQQLLVFSLQWKVGVVLVIEAGFFPLRFIVAGLAFFAVTAMVHIIIAMTIETDLGRFLILDRILVTSLTADISVPAFQAKFCVFIMIEF
jgi:hypothetical protein